MNVDVSNVIAVLSLLIAGISLIQVFNRDSKGAMKDFTRVETKLDTIGGDIKETRDDVKALRMRQEDMNERLVKVEESTKSAHHRLDTIEEKINKEGQA